MDQYTTPFLGSLWNKWHESVGEWRIESFRIGWLVAGSLCTASALGNRDMQEHGKDPAWDAVEAEALYSLLEQEVIPQFYIRKENGIPEKWIEKIRKSMAILTPQFLLTVLYGSTPKIIICLQLKGIYSGLQIKVQAV